MKKIIKASAVFLFLCVVTTASPSFAVAPTPVAPTPPTQYTQDPFKAIMVGGEKLVKSGTQYSQKMLFGLAGLGATATGAMAFFGRFRWNRFFILVGALLMMASADYGVQYITGGKGSLEKLGN
jgi:hypothetical protein